MSNSVAGGVFRAFLRRLCLVFLVWLVPSAGWAQTMAPTCPPQPIQPSAEAMQALFRDAKDRGFLWKIEKGGRSGHLYGSIHLGRQEWMVPGPKTMAALVASDTVALELDIFDPEIQRQMSDPSQFGIKPLGLPPLLKQRIEAVAKRVCAPVAALATLHPIMQWMTVTLFDARFSGFEVSYGSEVFLAGFARGANKPVVSLESAGLQVRALMDGEPEAVIEAIERGMALLETKQARAITERMINAWASGNLSDLADYQRWCDCATTESERKSFRKLNDQRNLGLAAGIDKLMRSGKSVFAAVGALHMTGPQSVPGLLAALGYKIERVVF